MSRRRDKQELRSGFSTGTAAAGAARAALRYQLTGAIPESIPVRLPTGEDFLVPVHGCWMDNAAALGCIIKDAGDDPDVTHRAEIHASVRLKSVGPGDAPGIMLIGGEGVGVVTKAGLPVSIGEPAINPVPRSMISQNLIEELISSGGNPISQFIRVEHTTKTEKPGVFLSFNGAGPALNNILLEVEIRVPKGLELARNTLNPRLGILGGISILGTTGIVKPFSHEAYEQTIQAAMKVAVAAGCRELVLSTGGKSEQYARKLIPDYKIESFVQIADFYEFGVREAVGMGFQGIVHSVFFGKVLKMAEGHPYTHAHRVPLDLLPLARMAEKDGHDKKFCNELARANTARHALEILLSRSAVNVIYAAARKALGVTRRISEKKLAARLLLFDYSGLLLADLKGESDAD